MNKGIFIAIAVVLVVWVAITVTLHNQEQQQIQITKIERENQIQDSVITSLVRVNANLEKTISQRDSLLKNQENVIQNYKNAIDSLSVIMRYLERADLSDRYRSKSKR